MTHPHLDNAPIVEAALDFRCPATKELNWDAIDKALQKELSTDYPKFDLQRAFQGQFTVDAKKGNSSTSISNLRNGARMQSEEKKRIVQFQKDGFVFSKIPPYIDWEDFTEEAFHLFDIHKKLFCPSDIVRIGVRFINRIEIDSLNNLHKILKVLPILPLEFNAETKKFLFHYNFSVKGTPYSANLIETVDIPINSTKAGVILDIDVFIKDIFSDLKIAKEHLENIRKIKNDIFFNSITTDAIKTMLPRS